MASEREWNSRYMRLAKEVATWSSCLSRNVGGIPLTGGDIKVITGKMVIKNGMNYQYVRDYR